MDQKVISISATTPKVTILGWEAGWEAKSTFMPQFWGVARKVGCL